MGKIVLPSKGINLAPGTLARGEGAVTQLDNFVVDAPGVYRSRQGTTRQANFLGGPVWKMLSDKLLNTNLLANWGTNTIANSLSYGDGSAAWTAISGTYTNLPATRMQMCIGNKNHYVTTDEGVRRIESDLTGWYAGLPIPLPPDLNGKVAQPLTCLGTTGAVWLASGSQVAYRSTLVKNDAQGIPMESAPSSIVEVLNSTGTTGFTGATSNVTIRHYLVQALGGGALTAAYRIRTYRTVSAVGDPGDECYLVDDHTITAGDISAGYYDFTDKTPDSFITSQLPLYTNRFSGAANASGGTGYINAAHQYPLRARAVEQFAGCVWLGNVQGFSQFSFTLLGVGASGLAAGDTITLNGVVFTADAYSGAAPAINNHFYVYTAAGSTTENCLRTAAYLVEAINKSTSSTGIYAQLFTTTGPGTPWYANVLLYARNPVGGDFGVTASLANATSTNPITSPALNGAALLSAQTQQPSGLSFSANDTGGVAPDGFPPANLILVPRQDASILALRTLRNQLFVFTDAGVYIVTGSSQADFAIELFEPTFHLLNGDSLALCDDAIYAWGREGVARITAAGVTYISGGIEPLLWQLVTPSNLAWVATTVFATAYRTYHKVIFHFPRSTSTAGDGYNCWKAFVYDTRQQAWSIFAWNTSGAGGAIIGRDCAVVRWSDDLLFAGQWNIAGSDSYQFKELRTYATTDYQDTLSTGATAAISKTLKWSTIAPAPDMETVWDQFHAFWEVSEVFAAWTSPTNVTFTFFSDAGGAGNQVQLQPNTTSRLSRGDVPIQEGVSTRIVVQMLHNVANEYVGVEGISLLYHTEGDGTVSS